MLIYNEFEIMRKLDHPNIAKAFGYVCSDDYEYLLMEYVESIDLFDYV